MKRDLIWGWIFAILAIIMLCFTFYGFYIGNDSGAIMCCIAASINISNAIVRFTEYKHLRDWNASWEKLNEVFQICWPDEENNELEEDSRITD